MGSGHHGRPDHRPDAGGWLTESFNWRWVFLINLPVGIVAFLGAGAYLPRSVTRIRRFDFFGFAMLSIAIGSLQLMLDRGAEVDWFASAETWTYLFLTVSGFWMFVVHIIGAEKPFLDPAMFTDRNFVTGLAFIFIVGIILLASLALLPPMLSRIFGYPTITTGLVMGPRGVGTMVSMLVVGRLVRRVDPRLLVTAGLMLTAASLYMMTDFTPQMNSTPIIVSGIIQGLGLGLVFVPLSTIAFSTIDPAYRADATSLFSLVRNIGSSIGISVVSVMLTRNVQVNHTEMGAAISAYNPVLRGLSPAAADSGSAALSQIDNLVNVQALMVSYIDDFKLMMVITLCALPLAFVLRRPARAAATPAIVHAD